MTKAQIQKLSKRCSLAIWVMVLSVFALIVGFSFRTNYQLQSGDVLVEVDYDTGNRFLKETEVTELVDHHFSQLGARVELKNLNLRALEKDVNAHPYIESSVAHIDILGRLHMRVEQKAPIVRVINSSNQTYYISSAGTKIPVSEAFTARVPVVSGHIKDNGLDQGALESDVSQKIFELARYLNQHKHWNALIEQLLVDKNGWIEMIPKIGVESIILGEVSELDEKFAKLEAFYNKADQYSWWNRYSAINLNYKNQIVGIK